MGGRNPHLTDFANDGAEHVCNGLLSLDNADADRLFCRQWFLPILPCGETLKRLCEDPPS